MFRNMVVFHIPDSFLITAGALEEKLQAHPLRPCSGVEKQRIGWVSVTPDGQLAYGLERDLLLRLGFETRVLPAGAVNLEVERRAVEYEKRHLHRPKRTALKQLKEEAVNALLPRAFTTRDYVLVWIDMRSHRVVVDSTGFTKADAAIAALRGALETFPALPLRATVSASVTMTAWLSQGSAPPPLSFGASCKLAATERGRVQYQDVELDHPLIREYLNDDYEAIQLSLQHEKGLSFCLTEDLQFRKLHVEGIVGGAKGSLEQDASLFFETTRSFLDQFTKDYCDVPDFTEQSTGASDGTDATSSPDQRTENEARESERLAA